MKIKHLSIGLLASTLLLSACGQDEPKEDKKQSENNKQSSKNSHSTLKDSFEKSHQNTSSAKSNTTPPN